MMFIDAVIIPWWGNHGISTFLNVNSVPSTETSITFGFLWIYNVYSLFDILGQIINKNGNNVLR